MTKFGKLLLAIVIVIILAVVVFFLQQKSPEITDDPPYTPEQALQDGISGNKDDLVSFSVLPGQKVSGKVSVIGSVKGGYFFEGNIIIGILDKDKNLTTYGPGHANATTDWMTAGPVSFSFDVDFTNIPKGPAYIEIHNDNASGLPENDKSILIPIIIE